MLIPVLNSSLSISTKDHRNLLSYIIWLFVTICISISGLFIYTCLIGCVPDIISWLPLVLGNYFACFRFGKPKHRIDDIEKCGGTTYCIAGNSCERFILANLANWQNSPKQSSPNYNFIQLIQYIELYRAQKSPNSNSAKSLDCKFARIRPL